MIKRIKVNLGPQSYDIHIEKGGLNNAGSIIERSTDSKNIVILSVATVFKIYGKSFCQSFRGTNVRFTTIIIPDGERQKNEHTLFNVLKKMAQMGLQKNSCLVALGGGVVGDLGGLAASI